MSWSVMFRFHLAKTTSSICLLRRCASFFECFCFVYVWASASTNLSTSSSVRDTNLSLVEFLAAFFWCIARGHRKLLVVVYFFRTSQGNRESMGKPLSKVARKKAHDVAKADWPYFHM